MRTKPFMIYGSIDGTTYGDRYYNDENQFEHHDHQLMTSAHPKQFAPEYTCEYNQMKTQRNQPHCHVSGCEKYAKVHGFCLTHVLNSNTNRIHLSFPPPVPPPSASSIKEEAPLRPQQLPALSSLLASKRLCSVNHQSSINRTPPPAVREAPGAPIMPSKVSKSVSPKPTTAAVAKKCRFPGGCNKLSRRRGLCMDHGGRHICKYDGCTKCAHRGGFCISHGGGRRCAIENCTKSAQSGGICYSHGGGKRCALANCNHAARTGGYCISHGKEFLGK